MLPDGSVSDTFCRLCRVSIRWNRWSALKMEAVRRIETQKKAVNGYRKGCLIRVYHVFGDTAILAETFFRRVAMPMKARQGQTQATREV